MRTCEFCIWWGDDGGGYLGHCSREPQGTVPYDYGCDDWEELGSEWVKGKPVGTPDSESPPASPPDSDTPPPDQQT